MKTSKKISTLMTAAASLLFAATGNAQQSINTFPDLVNTIFSPWGGDTATYGQTFTPVGGEMMPRSITFLIENDNAASIPFQAYVYKWNGNTITGPSLFQSTVSSVPDTGNSASQITVKLSSTGHGGLSLGQQYVVFYTVTGLGPPITSASWGWTSGNHAYTGGSLVFDNNDNTSFASLFSPWDGASDYSTSDFAFLLLFGPSAFSPYAVTPNQHAVASALDFAVATNNPGIQNLVNYLGGLPTTSLPSQFDQLSGEGYASIFYAQFAAAHLQNTDITNHLLAVHEQSNGAGVGLVSLDMASGGKTSSDGKESKGVITPAVDNRWGFFATANGEYSDVSGDNNGAGFDIASEGLTLGVDYRVLPQLVLGAYLGYEHTFSGLAGGGSIDGNGVTGGLYGTWFSHGFYIDGIAGGGYSNYTGQRFSVGGPARGNPDGSLLNTLLGGGYDMHLGGWSFGPQAGAEYDEAGMGGFTENGSLAPLHASSQSEDSLRSTAGLHATYTTTFNGMTVRPGVYALWQHEYDDTANSVGAQIAGTNAGFVVQGPNLGRDSALVGAGVSVDVSEKTSVSLNYEGQFGRDHLDQNAVSLGLHTKF